MIIVLCFSSDLKSLIFTNAVIEACNIKLIEKDTFNVALLMAVLLGDILLVCCRYFILSSEALLPSAKQNGEGPAERHIGLCACAMTADLLDGSRGKDLCPLNSATHTKIRTCKPGGGGGGGLEKVLLAFFLKSFKIKSEFQAWFEISNEIERRFYQEALSPDLKWRKQGLASLGRCCLIENAISPPNCEVFKPASKSGYPNI